MTDDTPAPAGRQVLPFDRLEPVPRCRCVSCYPLHAPEQEPAEAEPEQD